MSRLRNSSVYVADETRRKILLVRAASTSQGTEQTNEMKKNRATQRHFIAYSKRVEPRMGEKIKRGGKRWCAADKDSETDFVFVAQTSAVYSLLTGICLIQ